MSEGEDLAKRPTYEERRIAAKQHTKEVMGEATSENFMRAAQDHALADEYRDLTEWYTDAYDVALLSAHERYGTIPSAALQSLARQNARQSDPQKFNRLRELERVMERQALTHRNVVSAGHAAATEQKLETEWLL